MLIILPALVWVPYKWPMSTSDAKRADADTPQANRTGLDGVWTPAPLLASAHASIGGPIARINQRAATYRRLSAHMERIMHQPQPNRIGDHLRWPCIGPAIREARTDLSDAQWHGGDVQAAKARLDALEMEQRNGVLYVPPF